MTALLRVLQGGNIASLVARFGPLGESVIRIYTRQLLEGLCVRRCLHQMPCSGFAAFKTGAAAQYTGSLGGMRALISSLIDSHL